MLLFVSLMATWTSCSKSDDNEANSPKPVNPTPTNPTDKTDPKDDPYMIVCDHVEEISKKVDDYYDKSVSIKDMEKNLGEIKRLQNVEDAYVSGHSMFVKIKDYGKIMYSFFDKAETHDIAPNYNSFKVKNKRPRRITDYAYHSFQNYKKVLIANAQFLEDNKTDRRLVASEIHDEFKSFKDQFSSYGFDPKLINAPDIDLNFFSETIYDYDIVFLITHGSYDDETGLHWLSGFESPYFKNIEKLDEKTIYKHKDIPVDQVMFTKLKTNDDGTPVYWKISVSEEYITACEKKVSSSKYGKPLFFNVACESLKENSNMAKAFLKKGFGAYYGYNESNYYGQRAYFYMLNKLLSGMSLHNAYQALPDNYKSEKLSPFAHLSVLYNENTPDIVNYCLTRPNTSYIDLSTENELKIELAGYVPFYSKNLIVNEKDEWTFKQDELFTYGLYFSETKKIEDAEKLCEYSKDSYDFYYEYPQVFFTYTISCKPYSLGAMLQPAKTYYFWSYYFDGYDYYISDMDTFTIEAQKEPDTPQPDTNVSGQGNLPNVPGSDL